MKETTFQCPIDATIKAVGGKWKPLILWNLRKGAMRYSELERQIPGITQKMLSQHLKELEETGLIQRVVLGTVPPRVEYSFSEFGRTLEPLLEQMCKWGLLLMERHGQRQACAAVEDVPGA